jgi:hypothetical protein
MGSAAALAFNLALDERAGHRLNRIAGVLLAPSLFEFTRWSLARPFTLLYVPLRIMRLGIRQLRHFMSWRH